MCNTSPFAGGCSQGHQGHQLKACPFAAFRIFPPADKRFTETLPGLPLRPWESVCEKSAYFASQKDHRSSTPIPPSAAFEPALAAASRWIRLRLTQHSPQSQASLHRIRMYGRRWHGRPKTSTCRINWLAQILSESSTQTVARTTPERHKHTSPNLPLHNRERACTTCTATCSPWSCLRLLCL